MKNINYDIIADVYDLYVSTAFDVQFFINEAGKIKREILELMCGTGRVSIPLLKSGAKLTCLDYSAKMLHRFKEKLKDYEYDVKLIRMDVSELNLKQRFELIFIPFNSFSEILDMEKQILALRKIYEHLLPKGRFICTLHNPVVKIKSADGHLKLLGNYKTGSDKLLIYSLTQYNKNENLVTGSQFYEIYDGKNKLKEKRVMDIKFRLILKEEFEEMIFGIGLKASKVYGNYDYSEFKENQSPFMIYVLERL